MAGSAVQAVAGTAAEAVAGTAAQAVTGTAAKTVSGTAGVVPSRSSSPHSRRSRCLIRRRRQRQDYRHSDRQYGRRRRRCRQYLLDRTSAHTAVAYQVSHTRGGRLHLGRYPPGEVARSQKASDSLDSLAMRNTGTHVPTRCSSGTAYEIGPMHRRLVADWTGEALRVPGIFVAAVGKSVRRKTSPLPPTACARPPRYLPLLPLPLGILPPLPHCCGVPLQPPPPLSLIHI